MTEHVVLHVDGGARPNPGHGALAVAAYQGGRLVHVAGQYLGEDVSSNMAEHLALLAALRTARHLRDARCPSVHICSDSALTIKHLHGYPVQGRRLRPVVDQLLATYDELQSAGYAVTVEWVPRELVREANREIDRQLAGRPRLPMRVTGRHRVFRDVANMLDELGLDWSADGIDFITLKDGRALALLPYYQQVDGLAQPTIDEGSWEAISALEHDEVWVVWRPYGARVVPLQAAQLDKRLLGSMTVRDQADGGVEPLLSPRGALYTGDAIGVVGYNGRAIRPLCGATWRPMREVLG